jgi:hypothetical protein
MSIAVYKKVIKLFPKKPYLEDSVVRYNRRKYIAAVGYLQQSNKWAEVWRE